MDGEENDGEVRGEGEEEEAAAVGTGPNGAVILWANVIRRCGLISIHAAGRTDRQTVILR